MEQPSLVASNGDDDAGDRDGNPLLAGAELSSFVAFWRSTAATRRARGAYLP
jgi:hypothetical protein